MVWRNGHAVFPTVARASAAAIATGIYPGHNGISGGATAAHDAAVDWAETVLRDYVLPELRPDVVINWLTEPDHIQHALGAGSPEARRAIRNDDRQIGLVLERLETLGLAGRTNVIVVSDHGFGRTGHAVNVTLALIVDRAHRRRDLCRRPPGHRGRPAALYRQELAPAALGFPAGVG